MRAYKCIRAKFVCIIKYPQKANERERRKECINILNNNKPQTHVISNPGLLLPNYDDDQQYSFSLSLTVLFDDNGFRRTCFGKICASYLIINPIYGFFFVFASLTSFRTTCTKVCNVNIIINIISCCLFC